MAEYQLLNGVGYSPDQRTYQPPPPPSAPFEAPKVTSGAARVEGTVVEQAAQAMDWAHKQWRRHIDETNRDKSHYSPDGYRAQLVKFGETDAAKAVDAALESVRQRETQAAERYAKIRRDLSPNGDTAAELRATRYWNRTKALLDSAKDGAFTKAKQLLANANREELGTLLQELPAFLEARGMPTEWIDYDVGLIVPEYGQAAAQLKKARKARLIVEYNAQSLRKAFTEGQAGTSVILASSSNYDPDK